MTRGLTEKYKELFAQLVSAIGPGQPLLLYQPIKRSQQNLVTGVEALIRWSPPNARLRATVIISRAERTDLIHPLTKWILETALRQCHLWQEVGLPIGVSVNLSPLNLGDDSLPETVGSLLQECKVAPSHLRLEVTERRPIAHLDHAARILQKLRDIGVKIVIDDFGASNSSIPYLRRLPADEIKIDLHYTSNVENDITALTFLRGLIVLGHTVGKEVTIEGVENLVTMAIASELGCDAVQGYHISRPLPPEKVVPWLSKSGYAVETPQEKAQHPRLPLVTGGSSVSST